MATDLKVTQTATGVGKGFGAGLALAFGQGIAGPLLGNLVGALLAGWLVKEQRGVIALIAGMRLADSMFGAEPAQASAGASRPGVM